ncbi:MerR family transcriptional regulator [Streptomyces sp. NPDC051561]|uniref:MerR family transcriptional regulator n=1 Tax=Streptomyces sp. NPDC051561 TaxID=3365658 RepID=UPI0037B28E03
MSEEQRVRLRTVDVARESGYSVQQVRDLERLGVIPPAVRSGNGYRSYHSLHVQALRAYRGLAEAAGPVAARRLLAEVRTRSVEEVAAEISAVHVRLAGEREEVLRAQRALRVIRDEAHREWDGGGGGAGESGDSMTITELAAALGVRTSTLRFWEEEGLVVPERVTSLRARRYGLPAIGGARIVAALRGAGHGIPAVREVMVSLRGFDGLGDLGGRDDHGAREAQRVLGERLERIAARSVALLRAGADLAEVVTAAQAPQGA